MHTNLLLVIVCLQLVSMWRMAELSLKVFKSGIPRISFFEGINLTI